MHLTEGAAEAWLKEYGLAWESADPARAARLFAEDCRYYETPFSEPAVGRDAVRNYWQAVPDGQIDITFRFRIIAVQSPTLIAHWSASFTRASTHARVNLDGLFLLEFAESGLCSTLREWWHREETPQP